MPFNVFDAIVALCRERGVVLFGDEVYRGLEHDPSARLPAVAERLDDGVSLGTVSEAYGLPGLRLGWLVTRSAALRQAITGVKLYTTICSSAPSEVLVEVAVRQRERLVGDARALIATNLPLLDAFLARNEATFGWTRPDAAPIGFARWHGVEDTQRVCETAATQEGVLLLPGEVYGEPGFVRFGYGRRSIAEAIARLEAWLARGGRAGR
jgi:aspartate/methionine/tyrosine aminotransferase